MKFEMSLPFLSKTNKNLNILRTKKAFDVKGLSAGKNCLRPESAPLSQLEQIKYIYVCLSKQYITSTKNIFIK